MCVHTHAFGLTSAYALHVEAPGQLQLVIPQVLPTLFLEIISHEHGTPHIGCTGCLARPLNLIPLLPQSWDYKCIPPSVPGFILTWVLGNPTQVFILARLALPG